MISRSTLADNVCASIVNCSRTWSSCASAKRNPAYHPERARPWFPNRIRRYQPAIDAKLEIEQDLAQIERGDDYHCEANRKRKARVFAGKHERKAEGSEAQSRHRLHGGEARTPTRQQRQLGPPADESQDGNYHRGKASNSTRVQPLQAAG